MDTALMIVGALALYWLPTLVALALRCQSLGTVALLNLCLSWLAFFEVAEDLMRRRKA